MECSPHYLSGAKRSGCYRCCVVPYLLMLWWTLVPSLADPVPTDDLKKFDNHVLNLGQERTCEKLPLKGGGQCIYELVGLKAAHWYEVKISYPASVPASFSLDLLWEKSKDSISSGRKLLNTEKVIFYVNKGDVPAAAVLWVLVTVKPVGFLAKQDSEEQPFILYNIILEEVVLGIPLQAFRVGCLGLMAILASVLASRRVTSYLQSPRQLSLVRASKQVL